MRFKRWRRTKRRKRRRRTWSASRKKSAYMDRSSMYVQHVLWAMMTKSSTTNARSIKMLADKKGGRAFTKA